MSSATQNGKPVIELEAVTKIYGRDQAAMHALRGVGLRIQQGEFIAVMGPSGSGKSTCMNILGCLDTPTSGRYLFKGVDVGKLSRDQRALLRRHYLGFVFKACDRSALGFQQLFYNRSGIYSRRQARKADRSGHLLSSPKVKKPVHPAGRNTGR